MFDRLRRRNRPYYRHRSEERDEGILLIAFVCVAAAIFLVALFRATGALGAELATTQCPTPGEPCKILVITPMEEQMLIKQGGILDTAQAGRYIDLGNVVSYFRMKLANAPAGEIKPVAKPAEPQGNPSLGAGPANPAAKGGDAP